MADDTTTIDIPAELAEKAREKGWPRDLVRQALEAGAQPADLMRYMDMGVTAEQARRFMAQGPRAHAASGQTPQLDLSWMKVPTEWGTRAKPTKKGLTVSAINIGIYGVVPDHWPYQTEMPRGAVPIPGVEAMGYSIYDKHEVWAENAADLYEEAIQRRWRPATDIPWETIEPLPDDVERAMCQICTNLSEKAQLETDVLAGWEPEISYGYHEIKLYLATAIFEGARAVEVFRKRALSNGGGLGLQSTGWAFRSIADARNFSEMVAVQMVLNDSLTLVQYQYGERYAHNPAEKLIFRLAMQDKARHIAYGIAHLKFLLLEKPERRLEIQRYLDKGESLLAADDRDTANREAWAIVFAGGKDRILDGLKIYRQMRRRHVEQYLARLKWATLDRSDRLNPALRVYLDE